MGTSAKISFSEYTALYTASQRDTSFGEELAHPHPEEITREMQTA
jgi:hypothetical protein